MHNHAKYDTTTILKGRTKAYLQKMKEDEEEVEARDEGTHKSFEDSKERVEIATVSLSMD